MWTNKTIIKSIHLAFLNKKMLNNVYLIIAVGIIGVVCGIFLTILKTNFYFVIAGFSALILGGLYGIFVIFKTNKKIIGTTINYTFDKNEFIIVTDNGTSTISYTSITDIVQDQNTLLLFISKKKAYIVDKTTLNSDCIEYIKLKNLEKNYDF